MEIKNEDKKYKIIALSNYDIDRSQDAETMKKIIKERIGDISIRPITTSSYFDAIYDKIDKKN